MKTIFTLIFGIYFLSAFSQTEIPAIYSNIHTKGNKLYYKDSNSGKIKELNKLFSKKAFGDLEINLTNLIGNPKGTETGIKFNFNNKSLNGTLYYGFINYEDGKFNFPVFFKKTEKIKKGIASINIKHKLKGKYDMIDWEKTGKGTLGYRVVDDKGIILYDGRVSFKGKGPFTVVPTIIEGPSVNKVMPKEATIRFTTQIKTACTIFVNNETYKDNEPCFVHEIELKNLKPETKYNYTVACGENKFTYTFTTTPKAGVRKAFTFAYASDSRNGQGGGERNIFGTNAYMVKKIAAAAIANNSAFLQFSGDMIDGYLTDKNMMNLQYSNWKHATEPFAAYMPIYTVPGNHEALNHMFAGIKEAKNRKPIMIDRFPFATESAEAVYADNFCNFTNGPLSEDNSKYDPNPDKQDFPLYSETVYYHIYGNVAIIALNSDYWYAPSLEYEPGSSGNLHGYIMDNQFYWLEKSIKKLENAKGIDHIFITLHTPMFPNGGHSDDDMWYSGYNEQRPVIFGKKVDKGIIERRDEFLDLIVNKSKKVRAVLTGDEHNYNRVDINPKMPIYEEGKYQGKLKLKRSILQINNGAAGAPYYAQEKLPWSSFVSGFTTQNALVLIHVNGMNITAEVINPDTLELIDEFTIYSYQ